MAMALITPPSVKPLTLTQIKEFIKINHAHDDQLINDLLVQAISHLEAISGQKLINQTWRIYYDGLGNDGLLSIPAAPVNAISALRYFDPQGMPVIIDNSDYEVDLFSKPGKIRIKIPLCPTQSFNGIELDVILGFGDAGVDVPGNLMRALMLLVANWYEFRGSVEANDQPVSNPAGLTNLIAPWMEPRL